MFRIEDGREHFYQWDINRRLIVSDPEIIEVHFCNRTDDCSLVCETYVEDDVTLVDVPNILLQTDWKIRVYAYDGNYTKHDACYEVKSRTKPADYIYTETEVKNYEEYELRLQELEEREIPTKISELFDDTYESPEKNIKKAMYAEEAGYSELSNTAQFAFNAEFVYNADFANRAMCANCDENENPIADTYARKDEVPKDWQLLGIEEVMQGHIDLAGEAGIKAIGIACADDLLIACSELMAVVRIPTHTGNVANGAWRVGLSQDINTLPHYGNGWICSIYGGDKFYANKENEAVIISHFIGGSHLYTTSLTTDIDGCRRAMQASLSRIYPGEMGNVYFPVKLKDKTTYWIEIAEENDFKFPLGTTVQLYGR